MITLLCMCRVHLAPVRATLIDHLWASGEIGKLYTSSEYPPTVRMPAARADVRASNACATRATCEVPAVFAAVSTTTWRILLGRYVN
jgi:hypothetical protein